MLQRTEGVKVKKNEGRFRDLHYLGVRIYLEQLLGRASAVHIHLQTAVEKVPEHR